MNMNGEHIQQLRCSSCVFYTRNKWMAIAFAKVSHLSFILQIFTVIIDFLVPNTEKKNLLVSIRVYWFVENTPWYTQHFLSHSLILFYSISAFCYMATPPNTHQHEKHPHIPETTPTINHSLLWSISSSYKSAVLTLPNTKSSDAISTYGTQRTHTQHFPRFISCMWGKIHQFYPG